MPIEQPILITGTTGQVGGELLLWLETLGPLLAPTRAELDLGDEDSIRRYVRANEPRWIINPAAYTAVDKAESEPELAHAINAEAPRILGEEAERLGAAVLHFSTDYVFDGSGTTPYKETHPTGPLGVYGRTKLAGEQALAATGAAHIILRTSWVYGATGKNFLRTILRLARERSELRIVDDQFGAPTSTLELARAAKQVMSICEMNADLDDGDLFDSVGDLQGVYHASGAGQTSWYGFAREIVRLRRQMEPGVAFAKVIPIPSSEFPTPARRPANSRLDCRKVDRELDLRFRPWKEALADVLAKIPVV